jgi:hypothetical protein
MNRNREFDCRQCGLPHAPDKKQLCDLCAHEQKAQLAAEARRRECMQSHSSRMQMAAMFGGNRHDRRRQKVISRGRG